MRFVSSTQAHTRGISQTDKSHQRAAVSHFSPICHSIIRVMNTVNVFLLTQTI